MAVRFPAGVPCASCAQSIRNFRARPGAAARIAAVAVALALTAGCARDYGDAVTAFSEAARANETAMAATQKQMAGMLAEKQRDAVVERQGGRLSLQGCEAQSDECTLRFSLRDSPIQPLPLPAIEPPMAHILLLAAEIRNYAGGLKAIADADTIAQVEAAVDSTVGKVKKLVATTVKVAAETGTSQPPPRAVQADWSTPVAQGLKWVLGEYVRAVKLDALRHATRLADRPLNDAVDVFRQAGAAAQAGQKAEMAQAVTLAQAAFRNGGRTATNYDRLVEAVAVYHRFLKEPPSSVPDNLGRAHRRLAEALDGKPESLAEAIQGFEDVTSRAERLIAVLQAFEKFREEVQSTQKGPGES